MLPGDSVRGLAGWVNLFLCWDIARLSKVAGELVSGMTVFPMESLGLRGFRNLVVQSFMRYLRLFGHV